MVCPHHRVRRGSQLLLALVGVEDAGHDPPHLAGGLSTDGRNDRMGNHFQLKRCDDALELGQCLPGVEARHGIVDGVLYPGADTLRRDDCVRTLTCFAPTLSIRDVLPYVAAVKRSVEPPEKRLHRTTSRSVAALAHDWPAFLKTLAAAHPARITADRRHDTLTRPRLGLCPRAPLRP